MKTRLNLIETEPNQMWKNRKGNGKRNGSILFVLCIRLISFESISSMNIETKSYPDTRSVLGARYYFIKLSVVVSVTVELMLVLTT